MGKINSKQKGARYEREIASKLREFGYEARRTAQFCGNTGDASDVVGLDGIHIECKHCEQFHIYNWMAQAIHDSGENKKGNLPAVFFRKNNAETLVTMRLEDWIQLFREWDSSNKLSGDKSHE